MTEIRSTPLASTGTPITYTVDNLGATAEPDTAEFLDNPINRGEQGTYIGPSKVLGYHVTYTVTDAGRIVYVAVAEGMFTLGRLPDDGERPNAAFAAALRKTRPDEWRDIAAGLLAEFGDEPVRVGTYIKQPPHKDGDPIMVYEGQLDPAKYAAITARLDAEQS